MDGERDSNHEGIPMARSLAQIEHQIAKLKKQADEIKSKEKQGVIERIREAISHYGITRQELFGNEGGKPSRASASAKSGAPKGRRGGAKRTPSVAKYSDGAGRTWTGRGRKPAWIVSGLAEGKTLEDFAIKS